MNTPERPRCARDPDRLLHDLVDRSSSIVARREVTTVELYHRAATTVRVRRDASGSGPFVRYGTDDGVSVRLRGPGEAGTRFAASSGSDAATIDHAVALACTGTPAVRADAASWPNPERPRLDRDPDDRLPGPQELQDWLDEAVRQALESVTDPSPRLDQAWVEVASTIESWAVDGRPCASRSRLRGWAMLRLAPCPSHPGSPRPMFVAARSWRELSPTEWAERLDERRALDRPSPIDPDRPTAVTLLPAAAATLVAAVTRSVHGAGGPPSLPVGPGWRLRDAPHEPDALFGGSFDDAGFATRTLALADGHKADGKLVGAGHLRRPSFRDPPRALPSHLVVEPRETLSAAGDGVPVAGVTLHPLDTGAWVLGLDCGFETRERVFAVISVADLLRGCVAGSGASRLCHNGVRTPALRFEALRLSR